MKNKLFTPLLMCLGLLLLTFIGCTDPAVTETGVTETAAEEPETPSLFGAEILPSEEVDVLKAVRERIPSGDERAVLYFNGTELACLSNRRVFYATVPQPTNKDTPPDGVLTGPDGYRAVIDQAHLPKDIIKMMESGNRLAVSFFSETDYFAAEVILTYLPVISIDIDNEAELSHSLQGASLAVHDSASDNKLKRYTESRAEVKIRGGSSSGLPKKSIRIDLKDENGENSDQSFLGMRKDDDWILTAMFSDEDKIRDMTGWQLWREMNSPYPDVNGSCAPKMAYVEVILNGQYQGLYLFMEKFDAKTMKLEDGDALFKATSWDVPDSAGLKRQPAISLGYKAMEKKWPGTETKITGTWDAIAEYIRVAYETDGNGFTAGIGNIAAVENQLDYWIFNNITMAGDNTFKNAYYAVKEGLVYTLPWDLDISFGLNWNGDPATNYLYRDPLCISRTYDFQVGRRLIKYDDDAADYVKARWAELKESGIVTAEHIIANAESHRNLLWSSGAIARERTRWPTVSLSKNLDYFKSIVTRRILWLDDYISGLE
ncbi:MAG: CotH kinase family protein [Clostridia bacterium]|nr:CotH kinase family protein [Clostridia bacterium]